MAKKPIEEKHEFIKFIKELYTEDIQLNFDSYFIIKCGTGSNFKLYFPSNEYTYLTGNINLSTCPTLCNWLNDDSDKYVIFDNKSIDNIRKLKMSDFISLEVNQSSYILHCTDIDYEFNKNNSGNFKDIEMKTEFQFSLTADDLKNRSILVLYYDKKTNNITLNENSEYSILFENPMKNFQNIYKKDAKYNIYISYSYDGFRTICFEGIGKYCSIKQYFRVIT